VRESLPPLAARTFTVEELVREVDQGNLRIPRFQRGLRWDFSDVRKLFESILLGYPIGSLLLWQRKAPAEEIVLGSRRIAAQATDRALFVVDGQQRLTSLANALNHSGYGDSRFALDYDLRAAQFRAGRPDRPEAAVPLPVLFDLRRLLTWYTQHPEMADLVDEANDVATRIRQYPVPVSVVSVDDESVLRDIFDRMNNYGKRLTRAEVFSALNPVGAGAGLTIREIAERVDADLEFGTIDDDTVLRIILSRRGADVTREIRDEFDHGPSEFPGESRDDAFSAAEASLRSAVGFLQEGVGVPHVSLLPYRYLLVVLARFFAHFPEPAARNRVLLRRWFWRAAVLGPEIFKGSATGAMRALNNRIEPGRETDSVTALLDAASRSPLSLPSVRRFRTNEAAARIVLAALWDLGPRDLVDGAVTGRAEFAHTLSPGGSAASVAREIVPRRFLSQRWKMSAGNRLLLVGHGDQPDVRELLGRTPLEWSGEVAWNDVLASHLADDDALGLLADQRFDAFVEARTLRIESALERFLGRSAEWGADDTPPLADLDFDELDDVDDDEPDVEAGV
jgi:hypothetical protein